MDISDAESVATAVVGSSFKGHSNRRAAHRQGAGKSLSRLPAPAARRGRSAKAASVNTVVARPKILLYRRRYQLAKRLLDLALCMIALVAVIPVLAILAAAIWIDDCGPIVFTQMRTGKGGQRFRMYKFRTMFRNAEELKQAYAHLNELAWPDFKITNDPRITRVGRFLRRTSLDELPQIFNVIRGDMSLVGPRPTSFAPDTYQLWHMERLEVLPGITGLWQISGRSELDFDRRLRLDIQYIENQSLLLDLRILCGTVLAVCRQRGAC